MTLKIIRHRRNLVSELRETPEAFGVEIDIRSYGERLVLHHDPLIEGTDFEEWLGHYRHGTLILNVKEEALEEPVQALMQSFGIEDYFFLDQSFPFLIRSVGAGETRCAVRVSEFESLETAMSLAGKIDWVWVDCFTRFPLSGEDARVLQDGGFKLCIVSPELQDRSVEEIVEYRAIMAERGIVPEAVCTKAPDRWQA